MVCRFFVRIYKYESKNCAFDNLWLSIPGLIWLGVHSKDFLEVGKEPPTQNLSSADCKIIQDFWSLLPCGRVSAEIAKMLQHRFCWYIHSKYNPGNIEVYLTEKIIATQQEEGSPVAQRQQRRRPRRQK